MDVFKSLDIKQIQLDTLAYLISDHLIDLADLEHTEVFFQEAFFIYEDNRANSWSLINEAFARESFSNIPEFYDFSRRLENSIQAVSCIVGTIRAELLTKSLEDVVGYLQALRPEELAFDEDFMSKLCDNRDKDVIEYVDASGSVSKDLLQSLRSFDRSMIWMYTTLTLLLRSLAHSDSEMLNKITKEVNITPCVLIDQNPFNAERITFFQELLKAYSLPFSFDAEVLKNLCPTSDDVSGQNSIDYFVLSSLQWKAERIRWISLSLACFLKGQSAKMRKCAQGSVQDVCSQLDHSVQCLSEAIKGVENWSCSPINNFWPDQDNWNRSMSILEENWGKSLKGVNIILGGSRTLIQSCRKL